MKTYSRHVLFILLCSIVPILRLDARLIVTADPLDQQHPRASAHRLIIEREELLQSRLSTLDDFLHTLPGLQVVTQGPPGGQASLFMRGHEARHTLVMIDGIIVNDPSNPSNQYDFGHLGLHDIERIEVIQGPQAVAFGPGALAGVLSITTKRAMDQPEHRAQVALGSYWDRQLTVSSQTENLSLSSHFQKTRGFSAANPQDGSAPTPDGRELVTLRISARQNSEILGSLVFTGSLHQDLVEIDGIDAQGRPEDRPDDETKQVEFLAGVTQEKDWIPHRLRQRLQLSAFTHRRKTTQNDETTSFNSRRFQVHLDNQVVLNQFFSSIIAFEGRMEQSQTTQNESQKLWAPYTQLRFDHESFFIALGGRLNIEDYESTFFSEQVTTGLYLPLGSLKLSHARGHQAPSLFQRFDPSFGNPNLVRERGQSQDVSFESTPFLRGIVLSASAHRSRISDRFDFDPASFVTINAGSALIFGHHLGFRAPTFQQGEWGLHYQRLLARDQLTGTRLARRASHQVQTHLHQDLGEAFSVRVDLQYIGERREASGQRLSSYLLVGSNISRQFEQGELWIRLANLLNRDYEVVPGLQTPGRNFTLGWAQSF